MLTWFFNLFKTEQQIREEKILKECGCVCFCSECNEPLNDQAECWEDDEGLVYYKCQCGHKSRWLFDVPCPILLT
jgi:hypothetical protein